MRTCLALRLIWVFLSAVAAAPAMFAAERVVDLTAADATKLKATYFAAEKPGPGVLLLHQCNSQRRVWDDLGRQLAAAGISALTLDYRGFGDSGGDRFDKLPPEAQQNAAKKWAEDIDAAFRYLVAQPGISQDMIGVGGASCGVDNSIQIARRHPEVKSLVLLSGNSDLNGRKFLRIARLPVFFSAADDDEFPPTVLAIQLLYNLTANPEKRFVRYSTGGHGAEIFRIHPELNTLIVNWYVSTLIKTPGRAPASKEVPVVSQEGRTLGMIDEPDGASKVAQQLDKARKQDPKANLFSEAMVNVIGYEHLQEGDTAGAMQIFKLNVAAYPNSPNAYDSLSDAYLADGQKDLARQNAKRALELLPADTIDSEQQRKAIKTDAEQKLKQ